MDGDATSLRAYDESTLSQINPTSEHNLVTFADKKVSSQQQRSFIFILTKRVTGCHKISQASYKKQDLTVNKEILKFILYNLSSKGFNIKFKQ